MTDKIEKKKYRRMIHRLTLSFLTTTLLVIMFFWGLSSIVRKIGFDVFDKAHPAFFSFGLYTLCYVLALAVSYFAVWKVFKPLSRLSSASKKIAEGDYSVRLEYDGKVAELAETVENFNYMARELNSVEMIRNDFIANVSHEFKTPLSALNGYLMLMQDDSISDAERRQYISKAFFSIEKLNDLTDNILRLSKLENQTVMDAPVEYRLDEQLREAIVMLEPKWSSKNIGFELDLPEKTYTGQRSLLFQVWINILSNAIKFSDNGQTVTVNIEESEHHFKVYVSDEGIGMTEEQQRHIFDKFYQADTSRQAHGNGLGLALCKEIIAKCGGHIYVTSKLDEGTVFLVSLRKEFNYGHL